MGSATTVPATRYSIGPKRKAPSPWGRSICIATMVDPAAKALSSASRVVRGRLTKVPFSQASKSGGK
jgi:hypothetical protein